MQFDDSNRTSVGQRSIRNHDVTYEYKSLKTYGID